MNRASPALVGDWGLPLGSFMPRGLVLLILFGLLASAWPARAQGRVLDPAQYHLGTEGFPEWQEFVGKKQIGRAHV